MKIKWVAKNKYKTYPCVFWGLRQKCIIISNTDASNIITENPCLTIKAYQLFRKDKQFLALVDFFFYEGFLCKGHPLVLGKPNGKEGGYHLKRKIEILVLFAVTVLPCTRWLNMALVRKFWFLHFTPFLSTSLPPLSILSHSISWKYRMLSLLSLYWV